MFAKKTKLIGAFAVLLTLALGVSCKGFFVNPILSSITVTPATPSIAVGKTKQMTATGAYNDNSTSTNVKNLSWSISASDQATYATISQTGLVTGTAVSQATITVTATSGTISGSTTVTIVPPSLVSIAITPTSQSIASGGTQQFIATGTDQGGKQYTITNSVTWASSNTSVATIAATGLATGSTTTSGQTNITATLEGITSNTAVLTVQ